MARAATAYVAIKPDFKGFDRAIKDKLLAYKAPDVTVKIKPNVEGLNKAIKTALTGTATKEATRAGNSIGNAVSTSAAQSVQRKMTPLMRVRMEHAARDMVETYKKNFGADQLIDEDTIRKFEKGMTKRFGLLGARTARSQLTSHNRVVVAEAKRLQPVPLRTPTEHAAEDMAKAFRQNFMPDRLIDTASIRQIEAYMEHAFGRIGVTAARSMMREHNRYVVSEVKRIKGIKIKSEVDRVQLFKSASSAISGVANLFQRGLPGSLLKIPFQAMGSFVDLIGSVMPGAVKLGSEALSGLSKAFELAAEAAGSMIARNGAAGSSFGLFNTALTGAQGAMSVGAALAAGLADGIGAITVAAAASVAALVGLGAAAGLVAIGMSVLQAIIGGLLAVIVPLIAGITALVTEFTALGAVIVGGGVALLPGLFAAAAAAFGPLLLVASEFNKLFDNTATRTGALFVIFQRLKNAIFAVVTSGFIKAIERFVAGPLHQMFVGIDAVAQAWNRLLLGLLRMASSASAIAGINTILMLGAKLVTAMADAVQILGPALLDMAVKSAPAISMMIDSLGRFVAAFAGMMSGFSKSGQMGAFFGSLAVTVSKIVDVMIAGLPVAARLLELLVGPAQQFLDVLTMATTQFGNWLAQSSTADAFARFFSAMSWIMLSLVPLAQTLADAFLKLGPPLALMNSAAVPALQQLVTLFTDLLVNAAPGITLFLQEFTTMLADPATQQAIIQIGVAFGGFLAQLGAASSGLPGLLTMIAQLVTLFAQFMPFLSTTTDLFMGLALPITTLATKWLPALWSGFITFADIAVQSLQHVAEAGAKLKLPGAAAVVDSLDNIRVNMESTRATSLSALNDLANTGAWGAIAGNADYAGSHMFNMGKNALAGMGMVGAAAAAAAKQIASVINKPAPSSNFNTGFSAPVDTKMGGAGSAAGKKAGAQTAAGYLSTLVPAMKSINWYPLLKINPITRKALYKVGSNIVGLVAKGITSGRANLDKVSKFLTKAKAFRGSAGYVKRIQTALDRYTKSLTVYDKVAKKAGNLAYWQNMRQGIIDLQSQITQSLTSNRGLVGFFGFIPTPEEVQAQLDKQLNQLITFRDQLNALAAKGLDKNLLAEWAAAGPEQVGNAVQGLQVATTEQINKLNASYQGIGITAGQVATNTATTFYGYGLSTVDGFIEGIQSQSKQLADAVTKLFTQAVAAAKKALKIKSPSAVFADMGTDTMAGYQIGVQNSTGAVVGAVASVMRDVAATPTPVLSTSFARPNASALAGMADRPPVVNVKVYVGDREITDIVRVEYQRADEYQARRLLSSAQRGA